MFGFVDIKKSHFKGKNAVVTDNWISNGWWAVRKDVARMNFSVTGFAEKEDEDVERMISEVLKGNGKEYMRTSVAYFYRGLPRKTGIVFRRMDDVESMVLVNSECVFDFNIFSLFGDDWSSVSETKLPYIYSSVNPMFIVMPMAYDEKIVDDLKYLRKANDSEKSVWSEMEMQRDLVF